MNFRSEFGYDPAKIDDVLKIIKNDLKNNSTLLRFMGTDDIVISPVNGGTVMPIYLVCDKSTGEKIAVVKVAGKTKFKNGKWTDKKVPERSLERASIAFDRYDKLVSDIEWLPKFRFLNDKLGSGVLYTSYIPGVLWQEELNNGIFEINLGQQAGTIMSKLASNSWGKADHILDREDTIFMNNRLYKNKVVKVLDSFGADKELYRIAHDLNEKRLAPCYVLSNPSPKNWINSRGTLYAIDFDSTKLEYSPSRSIGELIGSILVLRYKEERFVSQVERLIKSIVDGYEKNWSVESVSVESILEDGVRWAAYYLLYRSGITKGNKWGFEGSDMIGDSVSMMREGRVLWLDI